MDALHRAPVSIRPCQRKGIITSMNGKSILVQCRRKDLGTNYAYFSVGGSALKIVYLNVKHGQVLPHHSESVSYAKYPEARLIHDGAAWNVDELKCWLRFAETEDVVND